MKIAVFGAAGKTGREIVRQALDAGHEVVAQRRDNYRFDISSPRLTEVYGDARDAEATNRTVSGADAVVSAMGNLIRRPNTELSDATQQIITAMRRNEVRRLICISSLGQGATRAKVRSWVFKFFLDHVSADVWNDKERQEEAVRNSRLDWILVRPGGMTAKPARGVYRVIPESEPLPRKPRIARADVADFILKNLSDPRYVHHAVGLSD